MPVSAKNARFPLFPRPPRGLNGPPSAGERQTAQMMSLSPLRPIFVCGPTASGKSAFALHLAETCGGEIVNADAFQLYRGLETLTAAPDSTDRARLPHHLYGVIGPDARMDAGSYLRLARPVIAEIIGRGKIPVITGGSGLYLKFLTHGPSPLPAGDPALRAELDARTLEELVAELQRLDPVEASRTDLQNRRYVTRALEICLLSGRPASTLRDQWAAATAAVAGNLRGFLLERPREELHRRIAARTRSMLDGGAVQEVAALPDASATCRKAIGFQEIRALVDGKTNRPACEEAINIATRQYAKRQETWFRRETWLQPIPADANPSPP